SFMYILSISFFSRFYNPENWTVLREIISIIGTVLLIGLLNVSYTCFVFDLNFTFRLVYLFLIYTLAVGMIPIVFIVILKEIKLRTVFEKSSKALNESLTQEIKQTTKPISNLILEFDDFKLEVIHLVFIQSSGNYLEIVFKKGNSFNRKIIRSTLKEIET